jgi:hypothetical protein
MNVRETPRAVARSVEWEFSQSTYAAVLADVPGALFSHWSQTAHEEFPGIPRDASFYAQSAEGLMMFFDCAAAAGRSCALPSRAADSVWHAWTQLDAAGLERFCIRHFGRSIPHIERASMQKGEMGKALAVCLVQARRRAAKPPAGPDLPRLFTLDTRLGMPRGFSYGIIGGVVACSDLDELGQPDGRPSFPNALAPQGLLQAGLISKAEYAKAGGPVRSLTHTTWTTIGCDGDCDGDSVCGDGDNGGGDAGGSACGGGCGGGGGCGS